MPRSNGSTGSTTAACWSRSATCRRPKPKRPTTGSWRTPPQSPPDSNETASEEVGTVQGFFLRKFASGRAMWGVRYHVGGKQRRVHLYDAAVRGKLAKARNEAADVRAKARLGTDVVAERTAAAEAMAKTITLGKVVERYLADRRDAKRKNGEPAWRPRYLLEVQRHLTKDWAPLVGTAIKAVTRQDNVIDDIAASQGRVAADRARTALSGLFAWAIDRGYADASPVIHIKPRAENG